MPSLRVLNLMGNPVRNKISYYRKIITVKCKDLQHLDDRPVFPRDRACAESWHVGGTEAEDATRNAWNKAEQKRVNDSVVALLNLRKHVRKTKSDSNLQEEIVEEDLKMEELEEDKDKNAQETNATKPAEIKSDSVLNNPALEFYEDTESSKTLTTPSSSLGSESDISNSENAVNDIVMPWQLTEASEKEESMRSRTKSTENKPIVENSEDKPLTEDHSFIDTENLFDIVNKNRNSDEVANQEDSFNISYNKNSHQTILIEEIDENDTEPGNKNQELDDVEQAGSDSYYEKYFRLTPSKCDRNEVNTMGDILVYHKDNICSNEKIFVIDSNSMKSEKSDVDLTENIASSSNSFSKDTNIVQNSRSEKDLVTSITLTPDTEDSLLDKNEQTNMSKNTISKEIVSMNTKFLENCTDSGISIAFNTIDQPSCSSMCIRNMDPNKRLSKDVADNTESDTDCSLSLVLTEGTEDSTSLNNSDIKLNNPDEPLTTYNKKLLTVLSHKEGPENLSDTTAPYTIKPIYNNFVSSDDDNDVKSRSPSNSTNLYHRNENFSFQYDQNESDLILELKNHKDTKELHKSAVELFTHSVNETKDAGSSTPFPNTVNVGCSTEDYNNKIDAVHDETTGITTENTTGSQNESIQTFTSQPQEEVLSNAQIVVNKLRALRKDISQSITTADYNIAKYKLRANFMENFKSINTQEIKQIYENSDEQKINNTESVLCSDDKIDNTEPESQFDRNKIEETATLSQHNSRLESGACEINDNKLLETEDNKNETSSNIANKEFDDDKDVIRYVNRSLELQMASSQVTESADSNK